ncbi:MAG: hypothetical protein ABI477_10370 [Chryseolinea sp.]
MRNLVMICVFVIGFSSHAEAKKVEGKIIRRTGTETVIFNVPFKLLSSRPDIERMQYRIRYYDKFGKKMILKPGEAEEIQFAYKNEVVRMISISNDLGLQGTFSRSTFVFLRLEIDGPLRLFKYYQTSSNNTGYYGAGISTGGGTYTTENLYLQKEGQKLKRPRTLNFRKDMADYLSDCPALVDRIRDKDFKRKDLEFIVMFYNKQCQ